MIQIENLKEKSLLVVRQLIVEKIKPTDEKIISVWCDLFSSDALMLNDTELLEWIRKHVNSNGIKSCDEQLERIRRKGERYLKAKCTYIGYDAKLVKQPKKKLATYDIFTKGKKYSGNYNSLCKRIGIISKNNIKIQSKSGK